MDIWDKDNTSIRINKFDKRLIARNNTAYDALYKFDLVENGSSIGVINNVFSDHCFI